MNYGPETEVEETVREEIKMLSCVVEKYKNLAQSYDCKDTNEDKILCKFYASEAVRVQNKLDLIKSENCL